jgi:type II secretory ATPase GspE/PulE/Tfp pilus assembly ATPase PilB-like protein
LRHLASGPELRTIITIEDPVECRIPGVTQSQINRVAGFNFATALRSALRQDPDMILVGEIRDRETASVALEAGLTGHFVATTVHASTAPQAFTRLLELGVEPFVLTTAVRGVVAQRLLRRRCWEPDCGKAAVICLRCKGMGHVGSVLIAEWLPMSEPLRNAILHRGDGHAMSAATRETPGYQSLMSRAQDLLRQGIISAEEIGRVFGPAATKL